MIPKWLFLYWRHKIFLRSQGWYATRERIFARQGRKCQGCGSKRNLQIHHVDHTGQPKPKWWHFLPLARFVMFEQDYSTLIVLCSDCHRTESKKKKPFAFVIVLSLIACGVQAQIPTQQAAPHTTVAPSPTATMDLGIIRSQILAVKSVNVRDSIGNVIGQKYSGEWVTVYKQEGLFCVISVEPKQVIYCPCLSGFGDGKDCK